MNIHIAPSKSTWSDIIKRPTRKSKDLHSIVSEVFEKVKAEGDQGLRYFTAQFDQVKINDLRVTDLEIKEAIENVNPQLKKAIQVAQENIKKFHQNQIFEERPVETMQGVNCWRKSTAIDKVGLYIPGGTAPLFSTVLMLGIPAKIAGCRDIVLVSPPNQEGKIHPAILYAAQLIGIEQIYKVGGIQAIAALTFGTESIPAVYKIFGPGNQFVTAAKERAILEGVAIDMPAGPSEVLVFADEFANPEFIAADLLSQAEHGIDSQSVLVSTSELIITKTKVEVEKQLALLPRKEIAAQSIANSIVIHIPTLSEAMDLINDYGPEHFIVMSKEEAEILARITNAGSVFIGDYTPESAGDYASGTNHTLPTNGFAKAYSGVSLDSFCKRITFQKITKEGLKLLGPSIEVMAENEKLDAHKNAVALRLKHTDANT